MRTAALALSLYALILAVVAGATWLGNGGHYGIDDQPHVEQAATLEQAPSTAVCTTDAECDAYAFHAGWDTTPVLVPAADGGEGYVCPMGGELYDTENPELGNTGVVCRNVYMEV
jgi:hypothetical protein